MDLLYAKNNYRKYKFDYEGYLVILDEIRTIDVLESEDYEKMKRQVKYLKNKYKNELKILDKNIEKRSDCITSLEKNKKIKKELFRLIELFPAITFIVFGIEKEIGIIR